MSLTKQDLQAIATVVDERLEVKLEEKLEVKLEEKLAPIRKDIKSIKREVKVIRSALNGIAADFDTRTADNTRRIVRLENHVGIATP